MHMDSITIIKMTTKQCPVFFKLDKVSKPILTTNVEWGKKKTVETVWHFEG